MGLTKLALHRPVSMVIGICALVVFGIMSIFSFPMELTPEMEMPMMIVNTVYPGANPDDVEKLVTKEVEDAVATLNGVKTVTSTSPAKICPWSYFNMNMVQTWIRLIRI